MGRGAATAEQGISTATLRRPASSGSAKEKNLRRVLVSYARREATRSSGVVDQRLFANLVFVGQAITEEISKFHEDWKPSASKGHDPFSQSLAPNLAQGTQDTRQFTSRLGTYLQQIAYKLAKERYGDSASRSLKSPAYSNAAKRIPEPENEKGDAIIWTTVNRKAVNDQAARLTAWAKRNGGSEDRRIGTPAFAKELKKTILEVRKAPAEAEAWNCQVDLAVLDPQIGIVEMKAGGNLDSTKSEVETQHLLQAALAYNDPKIPVHFALHYANRGEGKSPKSSLNTYFTSETDQESGLIVGREWWNRVLPQGVDLEQFLSCFAKVGKAYDFHPGSAK